MRCADRHGPEKTGLADVAAELGVTRQTVYRYFASTVDLLEATAVASADDFLDRLAGHVSSLGDPSEILVEGLCFSIEQLPREAYLGLMLATGRRSAFVLGTTSPTAVQFAKALLHRLPIDWQAVGMDDGRIEELVEFMLRLLQSFIIDPGDPPRTGADLRSFIAHWMSPALVPPPSTDMETD